MCASVGLASWITLEFHSCVNLEVLYTFRKFSTSLWSLVYIQTFLLCVYTFRVQPSLYGNKSPAYCTWLALSRNFQSGNYIVWTSISSIYLNLGLFSDYTQLCRKYLLILWLLSLYGELYKPSDPVGLVKTFFNIMLILLHYFLHVVRYYQIYT